MAITLTNDALVRRFNDATGFGLAKSHETISALCDVIVTTLGEGYNVRLQKLGTFKLSTKNAREAHVPSTGATIHVPAHTGIKFSPIPAVKEKLYNVKPA